MSKLNYLYENDKNEIEILLNTNKLIHVKNNNIVNSFITETNFKNWNGEGVNYREVEQKIKNVIAVKKETEINIVSSKKLIDLITNNTSLLIEVNYNTFSSYKEFKSFKDFNNFLTITRHDFNYFRIKNYSNGDNDFTYSGKIAKNEKIEIHLVKSINEMVEDGIINSRIRLEFLKKYNLNEINIIWRKLYR